MKFAALKKNQKVVDRWYSFTSNSFGINGIGVITKISRKHKTVDIKFNHQTLTYDQEHAEQFLKLHTRGMRQKYQGKIVPV
jgi:hypothetical protein